jgi:2-(1,2-epoxy-1,2-dihydrophenyl)acetyl-CoA isomerase
MRRGGGIGGAIIPAGVVGSAAAAPSTMPPMSESNEPVRTLRDGGVAILELNRPQALNALDVPTARGFHDAVQALAGDATVRAVVVRGAGRAFGVGGDLAVMHAGDAGAVAMQLIGPLHAAVLALQAMDAPVLASLHGAVAGGSMSLAMACDLAIASDDAKFNLAYVGIAASCDLSGSWHLPRLVGLRRAMEIALLPDAIGAEEAQRIGLVNRVVPRAELEAATLALAQRLANGPTLAHGRLKRLLRASLQNTLLAQLDAERDAFHASTGTADFREGLAAFFAKRPPQYRGS